MEHIVSTILDNTIVKYFNYFFNGKLEACSEKEKYHQTIDMVNILPNFWKIYFFILLTITIFFQTHN